MQHATAFFCPEGYAGPRCLAIVREASVVREAAALGMRAAREKKSQCAVRPHGGRPDSAAVDPVLLVPGFMAGDYSLNLMARHLRGLGYRTYRTGIWSNSRCLAETVEGLERRLESIVNRRERPVTLVGHSLGGLVARGLVSRRPDLVSGLVTLGSPLLAPRAVHPFLLLNIRVLLTLQRFGFPGVMGAECTVGECAQRMWEEAQQPIAPGLPFTSIYSRRDGIMDWRACLDPTADHVEVPTSHIGMALDPLVFDVVSDALAEIRALQLRSSMRVAGE